MLSPYHRKYLVDCRTKMFRVSVRNVYKTKQLPKTQHTLRGVGFTAYTHNTETHPKHRQTDRTTDTLARAHPATHTKHNSIQFTHSFKTYGHTRVRLRSAHAIRFAEAPPETSANVGRMRALCGWTVAMRQRWRKTRNWSWHFALCTSSRPNTYTRNVVLCAARARARARAACTTIHTHTHTLRQNLLLLYIYARIYVLQNTCSQTREEDSQTTVRYIYNVNKGRTLCECACTFAARLSSSTQNHTCDCFKCCI